jgi:uncharacterized membrane-anchored protein YitT (DUF2179 family)
MRDYKCHVQYDTIIIITIIVVITPPVMTYTIIKYIIIIIIIIIIVEGELNTTQMLVIQRRSLRELAAANPDVTVVSPMDTVDINDEYRPPVS